MAEEGQVKTDKLDPEAEARRRLALAQIRQYPDPVLRLRAQEVEEFDSDLVQLVERMTRLMHDAMGVGLAANQVGILRRVLVLQTDGEEEPRVLVNPAILDRSNETEEDTEGCLSLQGVVVPVERALRLRVEARRRARPSSSSSRVSRPGSLSTRSTISTASSSSTGRRRRAAARRLPCCGRQPRFDAGSRGNGAARR